MTDEANSRTTVILIGSLAMFGLALRAGLVSNLATLAGTALLGVAIYMWRSTHLVSAPPGSLRFALLFVVVVFAGVSAIGWPPRGIGPTSDALEQLPSVAWVSLAIFAYLTNRERELRTRVVFVSLIVTLTGTIGVIHIMSAEGVGLDVLALHEQAAEALQKGVNPYTDAVTVDNGAPTAAPDEVIEGYVYPPITAVLYAVGEWTTSDPRYTSLVAWVAFLIVVGAWVVRTSGHAPLLLLVALAALPGWPVVLRAAWTEPLTLALAALAFRWWSRPTTSGVFLGMTLGSKQYFAVTAPILALYRDAGWVRRTIWSVVIVGGTVGLALAVNSQAFWSSAIAFHLSTPVRADSLNLVGLFATTGVSVTFPSFLPILVGLVAGVITARWARDRAQFFLAMAFTLAISFLFSSQAFTNYWFLITGLCGLVLMSCLSTVERDAIDAPRRRVDNVT